MAGAGRDTIEALLKEVYVPGIVRQTNDEVYLAKILEASSDQIVEGSLVVVALSLGRSGGVGPYRERGALPDAGYQNPQRATYNLKSLAARGDITGKVIRSTRSNAAAFARALKFEADGLQRDLRDDFARQVYGGYDIAGAAAAGGVHASAAIAKIAVDNGSGSFDLTSDQAIRMGWIYPGMRLDATDDFVSTENAGGFAAPGTVESVDVDAPSITLTADDTGWAANDFLVRAGSIDTAGNVGLTGISAVISAEELGGLDPADPGLQDWQSGVDSAGGAFDSDNLHALWNKTRIAGGKESRSIVTTFGIIRDYFKELQSQVQYVEPMKLEGGFRVLSFMDRPFVGDVDCPLGSLFMPDTKAIRLAAEGDFAPLDEDGHFLHWVTGYDRYEWALQRDVEMIADQRNTSAKMTGMTDLGY